MAEIDQRLRDFIDTGAVPVSAQEIIAGAGVGGSTKGVRFGAVRSRRRVLVRVGALALVAGIVSIVFLVVPSVPKSAVQKASAATVLKAAATVAENEPALVPGPGQYLYVAVLDAGMYGETLPPSSHMFYYFADNLVQTWTSPRATGSQRWDVVGRPQFLTKRDRTIWVTDGSKPFESGSDSGDTSPYYDVADLPTKASAMRAFFATQPYTQTSPLDGRDASFQFNTALEFLQNGASSQQRAALLKYVASLHGVSLVGEATSIATNEKGSVIAMKTGRAGLTEEAIVNSATSELVEIRYVVTNAAKFGELLASVHGPTYVNGEVWTYTDYLGDGIAALGHLPTRPPKTPDVWPPDTTRSPLPDPVSK